MDRDTGRSRASASSRWAATPRRRAAINGMNGQAIEGRAVVVNEARPRESAPAGYGRSGGGGYGGVAAATAAVAAATVAVRAAVAAAMAAAAAVAVDRAVAAVATAVAADAVAAAVVATVAVVAAAAAAATDPTGRPPRGRRLATRSGDAWRRRFFFGGGRRGRLLAGAALAWATGEGAIEDRIGNRRSSLATMPICHGMTR